MKMVDEMPLDEWIRGNIKSLVEQEPAADDGLIAAWMSWHDRVLAEG